MQAYVLQDIPREVGSALQTRPVSSDDPQLRHVVLLRHALRPSRQPPRRHHQRLRILCRGHLHHNVLYLLPELAQARTS